MGGFIDFAAHKLPLSPGATYRERIERSERMLLRALNLKTTVAFIGSGCSRAFDYPLWDGFVRGLLDRTVEVFANLQAGGSALEYVQSLKEGVEKTPGELNQNALMFLVGACKKALRQNGLDHAYAEYVNEVFHKGRREPEDNPYEALLDLPIRRFVTTNYDCEIERALIRKHALPPEDYGLGEHLESLGPRAVRKSRLSLTQNPANLDRLVRFALAGEAGSQKGVFHCHGRFDDPDSVVATEADYQAWYLGASDGSSFAFQQTVQLLLESNPLLFIGYSLRDEDLLRPLRQLGVLDPGKKEARPVFALLACTSENKEVDYYTYESYFERFGLHVIPYEDRLDDRTGALCEELRRIARRWREASADWLRKPMLKTTVALARPPAPHCEIAAAAEVPVGRLDRLDAELSRRGVLVLTGPTGSGKSLHLLRLMQSLADPAGRGRLDFKGLFY